MIPPTGRVPPKDLGAEQAVLGGCLMGPHIDLVIDMLRPDDFYSDAHGRIWSAMLALVSSGSAIDTTTVRGALVDAGDMAQVGDAALFALTNTIPVAFHVEQHAARVRQLAQVRRVIRTAHEIAASGYGPIDDIEAWVDLAESDIMRAAELDTIAHARPLSELVPGVVDRVVDMAPGRLVGVSTGLKKLDDYTTGWNPGQLIVVAGRPGMGKTAFAELMCRACAMSGRAALWFSLEMPGEDLIRRQLSGEAHVDHANIRSGRLQDFDRDQIRRAGQDLARLPIYMLDTPAITVMTVRREARRLFRKLGGLGVIVVDYLQLMRAVDKRQPREQQVAEMSGGLKALAMELGVPVVALSQLNREVEKRPDKRPQLSDLRESGSLEQDSDVVIFIYRDEVYNRDSPDMGTAEIIIAKQRSGPVGVVRASFVKAYTRFGDLQVQEPLPGTDDDDPGPAQGRWTD